MSMYPINLEGEGLLPRRHHYTVYYTITMDGIGSFNYTTFAISANDEKSQIEELFGKNNIEKLQVKSGNRGMVIVNLLLKNEIFSHSCNIFSASPADQVKRMIKGLFYEDSRKHLVSIVIDKIERKGAYGWRR